MNEDVKRRPGRPARPVTREHLLRVARDAFSELGYAGASMGDIATRAGIRKSSLFHHFATKDELYREALAGVLDELGTFVMVAVQGEGPFLERMARSTIAVQRYLGGHPVAARMLLREFVDGGRALAAAGDALATILQAATSLLQAGIDEGVLPKQDPRHLVMSSAGVHMLFFALPDVTLRLFGVEAFGEDLVEARTQIVVQHIRRLMGVPG